MLRVALLLAVACVPSAVAFDSARCADYASKGYCTHNDYKEYMGKFCTDSCAEGGQAEASADEDASCGRWKESGYCEHEQYAEYMARACPTSCGASSAGGTSGTDEEEMVVGGLEPEEFDETGTEIVNGGAAAEPEVAQAQDGPENENCRAWVQQGCGCPPVYTMRTAPPVPPPACGHPISPA